MLLVAVSMAYGLLYLAIAKLVGNPPSDRVGGPWFQLGWLFTIAAFFCYFWMRGGQTTGMRAWKIQITTKDQLTPSLSQCLLRFLLAPVGWLLCFSAFFDRNNQCLHDKLSGTQLQLVDRGS